MMRTTVEEAFAMIRAIGPPTPPPILEDEGTAQERARVLAEEEEFRKNLDWFSSNARRLRDEHSGKFICVAGQELFVGEDSVEVFNRARAAHPDLIGGFFSKRLSKHRGPKIYANRRSLGQG
jgi:hypothetical protein